MTDLLPAIAGSMKQKLIEEQTERPDCFHVAAHQLRYGLVLSLTLDGDTFRLVLSRAGQSLAPAEVSDWRRAFGIPDSAQAEPGRLWRQNAPPSYAVKLTWNRHQQVAIALDREVDYATGEVVR